MQKYAALPNATQRILNIKADIINKLVDYYNETNAEIKRLEDENTGFIERYLSLHSDAQKLVTYTQLHGINPNLICYYSEQELLKMQRDGIKIRLPVKDFDNIRVTETGFEEIEPETDIHTEYSAKYSYLSQFCKKRY